MQRVGLDTFPDNEENIWTIRKYLDLKNDFCNDGS